MLNSRTTDELLRALADPLRARMVELLADEQMCTCHLSEATGARQASVSNHLRVLREAGLVEPELAGRYTYYQLRPAARASICAYYSDVADRAERSTRRRPCVGDQQAIGR